MERVWIVARWLLGNLRREIIMQCLPLPGWSCIHEGDSITSSPWSYVYKQPAHYSGIVGQVLCLVSPSCQIELETERGKFVPDRARCPDLLARGRQWHFECEYMFYDYRRLVECE